MDAATLERHNKNMIEEITRKKIDSHSAVCYRSKETIGVLEREALLILPILMYYALNGIFFVPPELSKAIEIPVTTSFFCGSVLLFVLNRARVHWELWTCRFAFLFFSYVIASASWGSRPCIAQYTRRS